MLSYVEKQKLKEEINETLKILNDNSPQENQLVEMLIHYMTEDEFQEYAPLYRHATEDMRTYYAPFNSVEDFLTVGSSGDQILNAVNMGAKRIDVFDKNNLSKRGCALKVAAAKRLSKEKLLEYFDNFNERIYQELRSELSKESDCAYWDSLYDMARPSIIRKKLFPYKGLPNYLERQINPYLDEENYELLRDKLKSVEINYIDSSLENISQHIQGRKYDAINFSNVYEYLNFGNNVSLENAKQFHDYVMGCIYPHVKEGGKIMAAYMYAFSESVRDFVSNAYKNEENFVLSRVIDITSVSRYMSGLTSQNLSYAFLMNAFEHDNVEYVKTDHIVYGQSFDDSHDLALMIKK